MFILCSTEQQKADPDNLLPPKGDVLCLCLLKNQEENFKTPNKTLWTETS